MDSWLITNATIVTMDDERRILAESDLLICGSDIAEVRPTGKRPADFPSERVLDATGMLALPGLINTHTHAAMTLLRGYADDMPLMPWLQERIWPFEMKLQPEDVYWGTLLGAAEMIRAGVTCFNDMYHYYEATARAVLDSGLRGVVSGVLLGFLPDAESRFEAAIDFAREWNQKGEGLLVTMLGPHAVYTVPDRFLTRALEVARELNIGIHIHVSETKGEVADSLRDSGKTPVQRLAKIGLFDIKPILAAHCVHLTEEDQATLVEKRVGLAHCPGSNMKLASGVAPISKLLKAGAIIGLGTDGPASNNNLDLLEEARLAALLHKLQDEDPTVVPAYSALEMATRGGAAALGLGDRIGQLKPGYKADIILLDFQQAHLFPPHDVISHLIYAARAGDVRTVFVNGRLLLRDRKLQTLDEQEIFGQVRSRLTRLV